jgi:F-type H+-transporting ATPase subunit b
MIELNRTLVYQIVTYFVLFYVLTKFLYRPVLKVLEERKRKTEGFLEEARGTEEGVKKGLADYEKNFKKAVLALQEKRAAVRKEAAQRGAAFLEKTRAEAQEEISRIKNELKAARIKEGETIKAESRKIAKEIAEKIIGRTLAFLVIALLPSLGYAGEAENASGMYWRIFNFTLLAAGLYIAWRKFLGPMLEERAAGIKRSIEEAERIKSEAKRKLKEYEETLAGFEKRVSEIKEKILNEALSEREKILKDAEDEARRLKEQARASVETEIKKAKTELRAELTELSLCLAAEILGKELKEEDQRRLTRDFLEKADIQ